MYKCYKIQFIFPQMYDNTDEVFRPERSVKRSPRQKRVQVIDINQPLLSKNAWGTEICLDNGISIKQKG